MASLTSSPALSFDSTTPASPLSPPPPQQQEGDDGDAVVRALEKLQCPTTAGSALLLEDDNQDDEGKAPSKAQDKHDASQPIVRLQHQLSQPRRHQPHQPDQLSLEKLESDRLKRENHALAQQVQDLVANYGRHVQSLQSQLQQQSASHDRAQREWQRQVHELRSAQGEATDSARRAQAQVQELEERLHQLEGPQYANNNSASPQPQPQQVPAEPTLRLTHHHQGQLQLQHPQTGPSGTLQHPHAVQRSVVNAAPRASGSANVTRHPQQPFSDASTVRATRIGRNRSAPSGSVAPQQSAPGDGYSPLTPVNTAVTRMTPPVNPLQWQNDASTCETTHSGYRGCSAPPAPAMAALMSVRPSAYFPSQNYSNSYHQPPAPLGYPPHQAQQQELSTSPLEPTLISICPIPDETADSQAQAADATGSGRPGLEKKPSSGLLAYCSELLSSTLAPVASVAPSLGNNNNTSMVTSPNARATPAWQLFSSSSSSSRSSAQLAKQSSLDVEQGFSPPHAH
ncbi:hypothetical protein Gpo141_00003307 [Globisporangium polare]